MNVYWHCIEDHPNKSRAKRGQGEEIYNVVKE